MKKHSIFFLLIFLTSIISYAQNINTLSKTQLIKSEDSLKKLSLKIIQGITIADRFNADSSFTKMLVRALKINHSFYYSFDSLQTISMLYAPDSTFKIFTWQLMANENLVRQHGAIQMKTQDGSLKLFPLIDKSDVTIKPEDTLSDNKGWIGAVYYKIIQKKNGNQNYYTLLGYDENNIRSNKKIMEVLSFSNTLPVFGGKYFSFEEDSIPKQFKHRMIIEYQKNAGARLNYDEELDLVLYEHLISETNQPDKKWTLVGDGDYEGFKWKNGKWVHIEKVFNYVTPLHQEPVPQPLDKKVILNDKELKN